MQDHLFSLTPASKYFSSPLFSVKDVRDGCAESLGPLLYASGADQHPVSGDEGRSSHRTHSADARVHGTLPVALLRGLLGEEEVDLVVVSVAVVWDEVGGDEPGVCRGGNEALCKPLRPSTLPRGTLIIAFVTVQQFLVGLCPHGGATAHAPEDDGVAAQEVCRQSCVQFPACARMELRPASCKMCRKRRNVESR